MSDWKGLWKCEKCGMIEEFHSSSHRDFSWEMCAGKMLPYERRAADEQMRELVGALKEAMAEVKEVQARLFRLSDLHDNMDHWLRMQEMNSDLQVGVIEPIAAILRKHGKE